MDITSFLELNQKTEKLDWWIEIRTANPICTYYFGAFNSFWEAISAKNGYIQDLKQEGAELLTIRIKQCKPTQLTIIGDRPKTRDFGIFSTAEAV